MIPNGIHFYDNHRLQTIFVLVQAFVIIAGSLTTGATMKLMGYEEGNGMELPLLPLLIRNWGFLLIVIPLAWTVLTIALEQRTDWHSKRWMIASGLLVLVLLGWLVVYAIGRSSQAMLSMSEG